MVDQRDIELALQFAAFSGREGLDPASTLVPGADDAADAAVDPCCRDAPIPAESLERLRQVLVWPEPQRDHWSVRRAPGTNVRNWAEQREVRLRIGFRHEH